MGQRTDRKQEIQDLAQRPAPVQMDRMTEIGARSIFNSDQDMFRASVRKFMKDVVVPQQQSFEDNGQPTREIWRAFGQQGMLGVGISSEVGGIGGSFLDEMIISEEMSYSFVS